MVACGGKWQQNSAADKQAWSLKAKQLNLAGKRAQSQHESAKTAARLSSQTRRDSRQLQLVDHAIEAGLLSTSYERPGPTSLLPVAAAAYAIEHGNTLPESIQDGKKRTSHMVDAQQGPGTVGHVHLHLGQQLANLETLPQETVQVCQESLAMQGEGLLGLADDGGFGLAETIVSRADQSVPGFVKSGHLQLSAEYRGVCEKPPDFEPEAALWPVTCQDLYGDRCKRDIKDQGRYNVALELQKNVVRYVKMFRSVKMGRSYHLAPDRPYPLLLARAADQMKCWLMYRVSFSPYDADWLNCELLNCEGSVLVEGAQAKPQFEHVPASELLRPCSHTMSELAFWHSSQNKDWECTMVNYTPSKGPPYLLTIDVGSANWHLFGNTNYFDSLLAHKPGNMSESEDENAEDNCTALRSASSFLNVATPAEPKAKAKPQAKTKGNTSKKPSAAKKRSAPKSGSAAGALPDRAELRYKLWVMVRGLFC
jgi:hypothetical protein